MNKVAQFEKISYEQFVRDWMDTFQDSNDVQRIYEQIELPRRATKGSAGYDFFLPCPITLEPQQCIKIPTGIRVRIEDGWVLQLFPRSSLGFKYRLQMNNTVGIIDSDYYGSSNEGHIFAKITNDSLEQKTLSLEAHEAFVQGIFLPFGICVDDAADGIRDGGFGSTNKG